MRRKRKRGFIPHHWSAASFGSTGPPPRPLSFPSLSLTSGSRYQSFLFSFLRSLAPAPDARTSPCCASRAKPLSVDSLPEVEHAKTPFLFSAIALDPFLHPMRISFPIRERCLWSVAGSSIIGDIRCSRVDSPQLCPYKNHPIPHRRSHALTPSPVLSCPLLMLTIAAAPPLLVAKCL